MFEVKEWLGHTQIQTTMSYVKDAKHYYKLAPFDWIHRTLRIIKHDGDCSMDSKRAKIGAPYPKSLREKGAGLRAPEHVSRRKKGQGTTEKRLFDFSTCEKVSSISLNLFFFSFSVIWQLFVFVKLQMNIFENYFSNSEEAVFYDDLFLF